MMNRGSAYQYGVNNYPANKNPPKFRPLQQINFFRLFWNQLSSIRTLSQFRSSTANVHVDINNFLLNADLIKSNQTI